MITIISGTNRRNSEALQFARHYQTLIASKTTEEVRLVALENLPHDWFHPDMYEPGFQSASLASVQDDAMIPAQKFIFIIPEYNGGYPGALKLFLDACSIRAYKPTFYEKKAALIGMATGRAGNIRGVEHFTGVLLHLGTVVMPNRLHISSIEKLLDAQGRLTDPGALAAIEKQVDEFLLF